MQEPADDPMIGSLLSDRYRVTGLAGEGGMGRVYLGEHEGIGRRVAIKCLLPEMAENASVVERFEREARAATACGSEHIIDVFDMGRLPDGAPYMVMEFLEGEDLGDLLERDGAQPIGRVVRIIRQTCDALEAAHAAGIVHRDLKPENIYLIQRKRRKDFVKVLDFGISKFTEHAAGVNKHLTQTGVTVGTPLYMSPEQAQGLKSTDHRTDIYALGVILYEALAGDPPFDADSFALLIVKIVTGDAPDIRIRRPDVPEGLSIVIGKCLSKSPELRFESVEELSDALEAYESIDAAPQLLEARGSRATVRPGEASTRSDGSPPTGAGLSSPTPVKTHVARPTPASVPTSTPAPALAPPTPGESHSEPTEPSLPATKSSGLVLAGAVLGVLGLGAAVVAATTLSSDEDPVEPVVAADTGVAQEADTADEASAPEALGAEVPEEVHLRVVVAPEGARIFLDDVEYPSPLDVRVARRLEPSRLRSELDGYETIEEVLLLDQDRDVLKVLERARRGTRMNGSSMNTVMEAASATEPALTPMESPMNSEMGATMGGGDGFREDF